MLEMRKLRKLFIYGLIGLVLTLVLATCNRPNTLRTQDQNTLPPAPEPLPAVAEVTEPELPDWIEQFSPIGQAETLAQIRIRFAEPLVAVESLESPDRKATLEKFEVFPPIPGQFRFLTPRMVGFQADRAIPKATRVRVTLKAGLKDLSGHRLDQDFAWTFTTEPIKITNLPGVDGRRGSADNPIDLEPVLEFNSNVRLDLDSLNKHLNLSTDDQENSIPVRVVEAAYEDDHLYPHEQFDASARPWQYHVTPKRPLEKATQYFLAIAPGLQPAGGNLPTVNSVDSLITTYSPLSFDSLEMAGAGQAGGATGRFTNGLGQLKFNNGLLAETAAEQITIDPPVKADTRLVRAYDNDNWVSLNPWSVEPNTNYTITIGADLEDRFGQTLGSPVTVNYTPSDLTGDLWAPTGLNIFPASQDLQLNLSAVNLPDGAYKAAYKVVQPTDLVKTDSAYPRDNKTNLLPDRGTWSSFAVAAEKNTFADIPVPLREQLGGNTGMLAYGVTARTSTYDSNGTQSWYEPSYYGLVQLTNLGVFAQWFPDSGQVRVHHLADGSAAQQSAITIYRSYTYDGNPPTGNPQPCATGKTDNSGTLKLNAQALKTCMNGAETFDDPPELLVIARENKDWAFARTTPYTGSSRYGIYAGWEGSQPISRGTVFSDRFLYQPGESAWLTGNAYYLQQGSLRQDKNSPYSIKLRGPEGDEIDLGTQTTNDFGTFSVKWDIGVDQPLGYYSVVATAKNGVELLGKLRVAEFKPPNFQVDLSLDQETAIAGESVSANVDSNYLFGAPVQGSEINYYVTRQPTTFLPEGWEDFSFGRRWYWPEERPIVSSDVLQTSATLNDQGQSELSVDIAGDLPYPMTYRLDAEVVDVSNLSVADTKDVTVLPGKYLIGLQTDFIADADQAFDVDVIVTDAMGQAQAGQSVQLLLERMTYSSVTQLIEGSISPNYQVEYELVDEVSVRSGDAATTVQLMAQEAGSYRIRATFTNGDENSATDTRIWVAGANPVYWGSRYNNNRLAVQLDKDSYTPGETATAMIQSPYESGELYFAVVRQNTLYEEVVPVSGGAPQVQFTVTPAMLPNAAVEVVLVRQGESLETVELNNLEDLTSIGFAPFQVDLADRYLKPEISPTQSEILPAAEQTLNLTLKDDKGQPVAGQFTVMVVDEAVLQLSGHRPPDLVETVYAEQAISTRFADNRSDVVIRPLSSPLEKGWGYGGGFSAGGENTRIRKDFQALAYYNGSILTDDQGQAQVSFTLPDNLTTWRVMVVATDGNLHFGNGDATFVATQPLITAPILPQFARPGDRMMAGLSVTNTTDQQGQLKIQGDAASGLSFADGESSTTLEERGKKGTQAYRFPMAVTTAGDAQIQFQTQLGDHSDGFQLPLPVKPLTITEQVVEAGVTTDSVTIPLNVDKTVVPDMGGLEVSLSSTLLTDIKAPVQQMEWIESLPNLSTVASQLSIAANLQILSQTYGQVLDGFDAKAQANQAMQRIKLLQRPDGGFASWPGKDTSDPFVTPYAARSLAQAKAAGFSVDGALTSQLQKYLSELLKNPGQVDWCTSSQCKSQIRLETLLALADLGDVRQDFLSYLYDQRQQFDWVGQIKLARYLSRLENWQDEADVLAEQIQESVYETARSATVNLPSGWGWCHSPVTAQAEVLNLFIARKGSPELLDRIVDGLLALRQDDSWGFPYNNAQALSALVTYAQRLPEPPNFEATVQLAGESLIQQQFQGYQQPSAELSVPMAELPNGKSDLILTKTGEGELHYLTAYRYRLKGNPPGRLQGLRVTRTVRPANESEVLYQMGLSPMKKNLSLDVGQVFDVGLEIISDHPVNHVVITDPLPAGLEPIDTSFQTSTAYFQPQQDSWEIGYQQLGRDRILAYADYLDTGVYTLHYLVRSVTPGTFLWPGSEVQLEYTPEEFGRAVTATLEVQSAA
ncbi:alpha-2-macroglobulin family protein [Leptothoe spongobia]|uniref:Alpha-2-macroglobulin family protein n=2 Tax=Leptothoe TaxID=2651725 RepID=A0A947DCJ3_9CYAN|nr:alpha-2-macroglobulin family protein [Leptothoe spongobia TAU-MAC 1115]